MMIDHERNILKEKDKFNVFQSINLQPEDDQLSTIYLLNNMKDNIKFREYPHKIHSQRVHKA